jgi:hypothetical protein
MGKQIVLTRRMAWKARVTLTSQQTHRLNVERLSSHSVAAYRLFALLLVVILGGRARFVWPRPWPACYSVTTASAC